MENKSIEKPNEKQMMPSIQIQKNIETIMEIEKSTISSRSVAEHFADKITVFAGSTPFIILHIIWFVLWGLINFNLVAGIAAFDPFPFSFLTLIVSLEVIFLTLLVLMSQNRMTKEADKRAHLELQINLLAEQESTITLKFVQKIAKHMGVELEADEIAQQLSEETNLQHMSESLDKEKT